jgi:crotonobetainyl-CoA:carnitine CoA-transferase CaiB-like acyl-CoA transferase
MPGPLTGVRIVDLTHVLNGPFCTMLLAHMGAEVLKIEYGSGDRYRHSWMPPDAGRDGYEFLVVNSNKKGITLNLKHKKGREIFLELVKKSDVVAENFSLGVMEKLGLGYEVLRKANPRIIYATSKGYGESGPYAPVRANASTIMAMSGWQYAAQELAHKAGIRALGIGDEAAGVSLALGICAALYARERSGQGQKLEVAMQEALMGFMVSTFHTYFENRPVAQPPKQCADGHYAFHLPDLPDPLWRRFAAAMDKPELAEDPRFASAKARRQNYHQLEELVSEWVRGKTRQELWEVLSALGLPSGPVRSLDELMKDPHLQERKAFTEIEHPQNGTTRLLAPWIRFSETPSAVTRAAPLVGQDNTEIYGELLGLSAEQLRSLAHEGVI